MPPCAGSMIYDWYERVSLKIRCRSTSDCRFDFAYLRRRSVFAGFADRPFRLSSSFCPDGLAWSSGVCTCSPALTFTFRGRHLIDRARSTYRFWALRHRIFANCHSIFDLLKWAGILKYACYDRRGLIYKDFCGEQHFRSDAASEAFWVKTSESSSILHLVCYSYPRRSPFLARLWSIEMVDSNGVWHCHDPQWKL